MAMQQVQSGSGVHREVLQPLQQQGSMPARVRGVSTSSSSAGGSMGTMAAGAAAASTGIGAPDPNRLSQYVLDLTDLEKREAALLALSKQREDYADLAPILWHSSVHALTPKASNRCCNALALLQCVASHQDTRSLFLGAHIPLYLYPFLNTTHSKRPFEYLRLTSLGVIGALVKMDDPDVIGFLLQTEIIPLCLRIMGTGSELLRTVATFIVQKILLDENGLTYICATPDRFYAVSDVLVGMVDNPDQPPSVRLLKHIINCYIRLSANHKARDALRETLPSKLRDNSFMNLLKDEPATRRHVATLLRDLSLSE